MEKIHKQFLIDNGFGYLNEKGKHFYKRDGFVILSDNGIWSVCDDTGIDILISKIYLVSIDELIKGFEESTGKQFLKKKST